MPSVPSRLKRLQAAVENAQTPGRRKQAQKQMDCFLRGLPRIVHRNGRVEDFEGTIAHGVSSDFQMGAGVAKAICQKHEFARPPNWNTPEQDLRPRPWLMGMLKECRGGNISVLHLVTSRSHNEGSAPWALRKSLDALKQLVKERNIDRVGIPRVTLGPDGMMWSVVLRTLKEIFVGVPVTFEVFHLEDDV